MACSESISAQRLRELLRYDPTSGIFTWLHPKRMQRAGPVAGSHSHRRGYVTIRVDGRRYYAHRLAWLWIHGEWPEEIDHINGVTSDNRICNLRNVGRVANMWNVRKTRPNKRGFTGVTLHKKSGLYFAHIKINTRLTSLGYYSAPEDAHAAYVAAKAKRDAGLWPT